MPLPTKITFQIVDPDEPEDGDWRSLQNPSPYVGLTPAKLEESLRFLQDPDGVVIEEPAIKVLFDYPLASAHLLTLRAPENVNHFTRAGLCRAIAAQYQKIYEEEDASTAVPVETIGEYNTRLNLNGPRGLMNRVTTDGTWGIWGHVLGDLDLHTVRRNEADDYWTMGIDS